MTIGKEALETFELSAPLEKAWDFLSDIEALGSCIPDCQGVRVTGDGEAELTIKMKIGYISKTFRMRTKITERKAPEYLAFVAKGDDAELSGTLELESSQKDKVLVTYKVLVTPRSALGKMATSLMGDDLVKKQTESFAKSVRERLA